MATPPTTPPPPTTASDDTISPSLRELIDRLPTEPGVYLMKDRKGRIIYIGKARSLRQRVRSYFAPASSDTRAFVPLLARLVADIDTVVVGNEKEALLLENNLIKQHQPRFNVKLVDDKNYLVLRLDPRARYPRLEVVRRMATDGARYFGPYHSASACRLALRVVNRHFKLRTCSDQVMASRTRPCLQYQIKRCDAPCVYPVPEADYAEQVRDVALFLDGHDEELVAGLEARMKAAAAALEFERAAALRDQLGALSRTLTAQRVVQDEPRDQDVVGLFREGAAATLAVLRVRQGKLLGREVFHLAGQEFPDDETVSAFVSAYYDRGAAAAIPDEVLLPCAIEDAEAKAEWLRERRGTTKVRVLHPQRGARAELVALAHKNAQTAWESRRDRGRDAEDALAAMREHLGLKRTPKRMECYDISHTQGTATVASMVVFVDGEPAKSEYRRFQVRSVENDDFAAMYEVLSRRFRRGLDEQAGEDEGGSKWALPDLVVIDGGKGQLGAALAALRDVGVDVDGPSGLDVVGMAKERFDEQAATGQAEAATETRSDVGEPRPAPGSAGSRPSSARQARVHARWRRGRGNSESAAHKPERVFLPRLKDAIALREHSAELYLLARLRDEAHRFAITYHRALRQKQTVRSLLGDIAGVGKQRQRELLRRFGSVRGVRAASLEELLATPGMNRAAAQAVRRHFEQEGTAASPGQPTLEPTAGAGRDVEAALAALLPEVGPETKSPRSARRRPDHLDDREDVAEDAAGEELRDLVGGLGDDDSRAADDE